MSLHRFIITSFAISALALIGLAQTTPTPTAAAQPIAAQPKPAEPKLSWHDVTTWGVEGRAFGNLKRERWFDRFPAIADGKVTPAVWNLSRDSAGMMVRFKTDSAIIWADYTLFRERLNGVNMTPIGASGLDLYARDDAGLWRWVGVARPDKKKSALNSLIVSRPDIANTPSTYRSITGWKNSRSASIPRPNLLRSRRAPISPLYFTAPPLRTALALRAQGWCIPPFSVAGLTVQSST